MAKKIKAITLVFSLMITPFYLLAGPAQSTEKKQKNVELNREYKIIPVQHVINENTLPFNIYYVEQEVYKHNPTSFKKKYYYTILNKHEVPSHPHIACPTRMKSLLKNAPKIIWHKYVEKKEEDYITYTPAFELLKAWAFKEILTTYNIRYTQALSNLANACKD